MAKKTLLNKYDTGDGRSSGNAMTTGTTPGTKVREWAEQNGLILPKPEETGDLIKDIQANTYNRLCQLEIMEKAVELYKVTSARGTRVFDELIALDVDITNRRSKLRSEGIDPLEDKHLQDALALKLDMMKFLEKIKWDKEREYVKLKSEKARSNKEFDDLFTIDAEYAYERDKNNTFPK